MTNRELDCTLSWRKGILSPLKRLAKHLFNLTEYEFVMILALADGNGQHDLTSSREIEASNQICKYQQWADTYKPNHVSPVDCSLPKSVLSKTEMPLIYNTNVVKDVTIIQNTDPSYIWTLLNVPGFDGLSVTSGIEHEGYLGFLITEVPHKGMPIKVNLPRSIKEALAT